MEACPREIRLKGGEKMRAAKRGLIQTPFTGMAVLEGSSDCQLNLKRGNHFRMDGRTDIWTDGFMDKSNIDPFINLYRK